MNTRERYLSVLNFQKPAGRLPMFEWAWWWDKTFERWQGDGLPEGMQDADLFDYFGLDYLACVNATTISAECPKPAYHGAPRIIGEAGYDAVRPLILNDALIAAIKGEALAVRERHARGDIALRLWLDGFFWFPRSLFGIENHLMAFYDYPRLMHRMNSDLADFELKVMEEIFPIITPDMVGFAEDMSYNHGPMLSRAMFNEFMAPYYKRVVPYIKSRNIKVMVDSDGDVAQIIPWFLPLGVDGIYPLERQAGVDVAALRRTYPKLLMMGAYDKMVMSKGEAEMRGEFERLLPVMKTGGYVPSVDHQTPPGVSLDNYKIYLRLFAEYCEKAVL
ncbi:MAG: hypothetical protein FWH01_06330 [Oscillospiraceae bacterium]|nr:hypothetical protein [Oscillospiraceae bacterium]